MCWEFAWIYYLPQWPEQIINIFTGNWSLTTSTKLFGVAEYVVWFFFACSKGCDNSFVTGHLEIGDCCMLVYPICIWVVVKHSVNLSWYRCFLVLKHPRSSEWLYIIASWRRYVVHLYPWVSIRIWIYIIIVYFLYIENRIGKCLQVRHKFYILYFKVFPKTE